MIEKFDIIEFGMTLHIKNRHVVVTDIDFDGIGTLHAEYRMNNDDDIINFLHDYFCYDNIDLIKRFSLIYEGNDNSYVGLKGKIHNSLIKEKG